VNYTGTKKGSIIK